MRSVLNGGGFVIMGVGLWLFSPALSLTVCGGVLFALTVYAQMKES